MGDTLASGTTDEPLIGATINGRYRIISLIARGGMGKVFKAEQSALGRLCALKVLSPKYQGDKDPEFHRRFSLEAATASKLTHPNTVTIFDHGKCELHDVYYIAMEYLDGRTLHEVLHEVGWLPEARASRIAQQICRSVSEAHSRGVVHRDLKPGNVMLLDRDEEKDFVKVLDFGLVKDVTGEAEDLTQTGLFMGSPKYMSPEQITGGEVSPRTDIYALGVILFEMLSGKVPFDKKVSMNTLMAHVNDAPPRMSDKNPEVAVSEAMEAVVMRCLEKDPGKRFSSMRDMLGSLKRTTGDASETYEGLPLVKIDPNKISQSDLPISSSVGRTTDSKILVPPPPPSGSGANRAVSSPALGADDSLAPPPAPPTFSGVLQQPQTPIKAYLFAALAAVIGGGAIVAVMRPKDPAPGGPQPVVTMVVQVPASASPEAANGAGQIRSVLVESDPPGAGVADRGVEVCMATPCELTWRGQSAKSEHKLTVFKHGFKAATITVGPSDEKVSAKLETAPVGYTAPPVQAMTAGASAAPLPDLPTVAPPPSSAEPVAAVAPTATAAVTQPTVDPAAAAPTATAAAAAGGVVPFGEGMTRPARVSGPAPVYSREAIEARVGGTVLAKCVITSAGSVTGCRIIKGLPYLDSAVLSALAASKYSPATKDGKPVSVDYVITMNLAAP